FETYYAHGSIQSKGSRKNGLLDGLFQYFDTDGKLYYEYDYKVDEIIGYRFYDKTGEVIAKGKRRGGEFYYKGYTAAGQIDSEGLYDVSGGKKGDWKFYSSNGVLIQEANFQEDQLTGDLTEYYPTGELQTKSSYDHGVLQGYQSGYHMN